MTGSTQSADFPTTAGAFQATFGGLVVDAFVTKFDPTGSALAYSTYLGRAGDDLGAGIAVDALGSAYITGETSSALFPTTPGAFQTSLAGARNAFVSRLNPTGSALVYSTYLGGSILESGTGIAIDVVGNAYVTGLTHSADFPTTPGAFQSASGGDIDAFATKLNPSGSAVIYSTYVGGSGIDVSLGIAVDGLGRAHLTGRTDSGDFPATPRAFQTSGGESMTPS